MVHQESSTGMLESRLMNSCLEKTRVRVPGRKTREYSVKRIELSFSGDLVETFPLALVEVDPLARFYVIERIKRRDNGRI